MKQLTFYKRLGLRLQQLFLVFCSFVLALTIIPSGVASAVSRFTEYSYPVNGSWMETAALGPDGAMWFSEGSMDAWPASQVQFAIAKVDTAGTVTRYPLTSTTSYRASSIAAGPDGAMWFTEDQWHDENRLRRGDRIGRIDMNGNITEFPQFATTSLPSSIAAGPDGAMWFTNSFTRNVGRIDMAGNITLYPSPQAFSNANSITAGPDGAMWVTQATNGGFPPAVARVDMNGNFTEYLTPQSGNVGSIVTGTDGALWFLQSNTYNRWLVRVTTSGVFTYHSLPFVTPPGQQSFDYYSDLTVGSDGRLWLGRSLQNAIGYWTASSGWVQYVLPRTNTAHVTRPVFGADSNLWFGSRTDNGNYTFVGYINKFNPEPPVTAPTNLTALSPTKQSPQLSWNAVAGVTSYNVYRNNSQIGSTNTTSYTDNSASEGSNTYHVKAVGPYEEGNKSNEVTVLFDQTLPTLNYTASPAPNTNNWNNTNITVTFTCNDALSDIASCTSPVTLSSEGANQTAIGTATDEAGNNQSLTTSTFKIDKTAPTTGSIALSGSGYINLPGFPPLIPAMRFVTNGSVTITSPSSDTLSGVWNGEYFIDTDPGNGNGQPMALNGSNLSSAFATTSIASGNHTLYVRSKDMAGNWSVPSLLTFTKL